MLDALFSNINPPPQKKKFIYVFYLIHVHWFHISSAK